MQHVLASMFEVGAAVENCIVSLSIFSEIGQFFLNFQHDK